MPATRPATFLRNRRFIAGTIFLFSMLVFGCNKERTEVVQKPAQNQQTLLIGLLPEQSIFKQIRRYEPLADYLSQQLGMNVKLTVIPGYGKALSSFRDRKMDAAFLGDMSYLLAHTRLGVEVLARPVGLDGTSTHHGVIIVRTDSSIRSIRDMKGKRFAFVDKDTMSGYYLPIAYFKKKGVDHIAYLKEFYFAGTHEDVIYDVLDRKADIGAVKSTVLTGLAIENKRVRNELRILLHTPDMPENGLVVRRDLDPSLKEKLKAAILNMHTDPDGARILQNFRASRFIETMDRDYTAAYSLALELGIDLHPRNDATSP
jgi:phosphonate transport system substrate-binding protein